MIYRIPRSNLEKLQKKLKHIQNKGANVVFNIIKRNDIEQDDGTFIPAYDVDVEGLYRVNGWNFAATIEHKDNGNVIRSINDDLIKDMPDRYRTAGPECEHCNKIRDRKDTYLIYNDETGEWKQVGKSCLKEYTSGLDATVCAQIAEFISEAAEAADPGKIILSGERSFPSDRVKKLTIDEVKKNGYEKFKTVDILLKKLEDKLESPEATDEDVTEITEWVKSKAPESNYFTNADVLWNSSFLEARDLPLLASSVNVYLTEKAKKAREETFKDKQANSTWQGNVGDVIEFKPVSIKALYTKDNSIYSYYAASSTVYEIIDDKGNVYIYDTANDLLTQYEDAREWTDDITIKGRVKAHKEYRGLQQTVLTRCKLLVNGTNPRSRIAGLKDLDSIEEE